MERNILPAGFMEEMLATELVEVFHIPIRLARLIVDATQKIEDPIAYKARLYENTEFLMDFIDQFDEDLFSD